jgi:hypothetical protein
MQWSNGNLKDCPTQQIKTLKVSVVTLYYFQKIFSQTIKAYHILNESVKYMENVASLKQWQQEKKENITDWF